MSTFEDQPPRIYLDNAATSWPKPASVYEAVNDYQRHLGAPAGRSGYSEATEVAARIEATRRRLATFVGLRESSHLIFTFNGTDSLNLVLHGLLAAGDHVVTTVVEHNSVLRPLATLEHVGVTAAYVGCSTNGIVDPDEIRKALRSHTKLVAITQASNVTGALQPVAEIARIAHDAGALVLCDAAQTVGHVAVDREQLDVDFLAAPGHKGTLGPLGTGILAIHPAAASKLHSIRQGGTGTESERAEQPDDLPAKFESGNLNVPGILGLGAGIEYLQSRGIDEIERHGQELCARLLDGLREIAGIHVLGPPTAAERVPVVSIQSKAFDPQELALVLDAAHRIQVRSGLHCAPKMHEALGTQASGGTVRFSLGPFNSAAEIDTVIQAVAELSAG